MQALFSIHRIILEPLPSNAATSPQLLLTTDYLPATVVRHSLFLFLPPLPPPCLFLLPLSLSSSSSYTASSCSFLLLSSPPPLLPSSFSFLLFLHAFLLFFFVFKTQICNGVPFVGKLVPTDTYRSS